MSRIRRFPKHFETVLDYFRFAISEAGRQELYYGHGTDNAWDDMLALLTHTLHLPADAPLALLQTKLSQDEKKNLEHALSLRLYERIPVPYITGRSVHFGLEFLVNESVLIPRSPIAEFLQNQGGAFVEPNRVRRILDLCTGSGCLAIMAAYAFPDAFVDGSDISLDALMVAEQNIAMHGLEDQVQCIHSDLLESVPEIPYDIIISNPPYVGDAEMAELPAEYLHEPDSALRAPDNGLALVEQMLREAPRYLSEHGILVVEVGNSETELVERYPEVPFIWLEFEHGGQGVFLLTKTDLEVHFSA